VRVTTPDGVVVAAQDWAAPADRGVRQDILFLHGYSQDHRCWQHQLAGPLSREFRLVTYDLRGHGDSDKPDDPAYYQNARRWADELQAVITTLGLHRPVVVAWSYAGRNLMDYLSVYGEAALGAIVLAGASTSTAPDRLGPDAQWLRKMTDADPAVATAATRAMLQACFAHPLPEDEFEALMATNQRVPSRVRGYLRGRVSPDYGPVLRALQLPALVIHGEQDTINLPAMARYSVRQLRDAELHFYADVAHVPFAEAPARFDADVAAFIRERITP
jgi:pimeloyl-ACP methyl ester carboxylesterase